MMDIIRRRRRSIVLFLVFLFFSTQNYFIGVLSLGSMNNNNIICKPSERRALLSFKQHLKDPYNMNSLSSWRPSGENCCGWAGVVCSNTTDHHHHHHVVQLHLQELGLGGELNPSLLELKQLRHLDLSWNDFYGIRIPDFLGSLQSLRYLNLSRAGFSGMIPHQLGNLSNLCYLDLSFKYGSASSNFQWISHLSSLEYLDLSHTYLENANWFHDVVNMLPSLLVLRLHGCSLSSGALPTTTSLSHVNNFTSLQVLDLGVNNINSTLPEWLYSLTNLQQLDLSDNRFQGTISPSIGGNLTKLTLLDLSYNSFQGTIPASVGNLTKLTLLDLSYNKLIEGEIPKSIGNLCNLQRLDLHNNKLQGTISPSSIIGNLSKLTLLDLSDNQLSGPLPDELGRLSLLETLNIRNNKFNGSLPESLGNLSKLGVLDMTENAFQGIVSEVHFANLTNLQYLSMDSPSLVFNVTHEWVPPFRLVSAKLRNCQLGPGFPMWLRTQKNLTDLELSRTGISGIIPTWFWNFTSSSSDNFFRFDLSQNELHGELPKVISATSINLRSNQLSGQLPRVNSNVEELDLSNNSFSGPISTFLCNPPTSSSSSSSSSSEINNLLVLDLSDNHFLSGNLSECWVYWTSLKLLMLDGNKITGKIPSSMGSSLLELQVLHLGNNRLSGELPSSLRNCTSLKSIDLGENGLTGRLPIWFGESFPELQFLRLRSNKFYDEIPREFCHLASIRVLDIAHNDLRGSIPKCFNNFSSIAIKKQILFIWPNYWGAERDTTTLVTKGREVEYNSIIIRSYVTSLDLSNNSLSGEIPEELTSLIGLISFNLSDNRFTGKIPEKIGNMYSLESLDFSKNRISGVIPQSISNLSFLSVLNLSFNNLSGKIPLGTQLQSFYMSSYIGNQELCGPPLNKCNGGEELTQKPGDIGDRADEDEDWFEMKWFYMSMGVGFVFGFWVLCGVMVLKSSWRIAYFRFLDDTKDKLCLLF